jgi:hypothetical protein
VHEANFEQQAMNRASLRCPIPSCLNEQLSGH